MSTENQSSIFLTKNIQAVFSSLDENSAPSLADMVAVAKDIPKPLDPTTPSAPSSSPEGIYTQNESPWSSNIH